MFTHVSLGRLSSSGRQVASIKIARGEKKNIQQSQVFTQEASHIRPSAYWWYYYFLQHQDVIVLTSDQKVAPASVLFSTFSVIHVMCIDKTTY